MKRDEPFDPSIKSSLPPEGLKFRLASQADCDAIAALMAERNPNRELFEVIKGTERELSRVSPDSDYKLYVAELNGEVLGFCRFWHSSGLPAARKTFPAPEGWYAMGIMVHSKSRRKGIARFLSVNRVDALRELKIGEIYSIVDAKNLTSLRMHQDFGFEEIARAPGFLHIKFEAGTGSLFRLTI